LEVVDMGKSGLRQSAKDTARAPAGPF